MATLLKMYIFTASVVKTSMAFFVEIGKNKTKFIWKRERSKLAKAILSKQNNARSYAIVTKKYNTDKWNRTPRIKCAQLRSPNFNKSFKMVH